MPQGLRQITQFSAQHVDAIADDDVAVEGPFGGEFREGKNLGFGEVLAEVHEQVQKC